MLKKHYGKKGFTMMETLITVAILVILAAISFTGYHFISRNLRQTKLDSTAQIIYTSAQNRLEELYANGRLNAVSQKGTELSYQPSDWAGAASDTKLYVVSKINSNDTDVMNLLFPKGSISDEVAANKYVVEYDPNSGSIYAVFYSEEENYTLEQIHQDNYRNNENRKKDGARVGYYGGGVLSALGDSKINTLIGSVNVINGEELVANVSAKIPDDLTNDSFRITVSIENDKGSVVEMTRDVTITTNTYSDSIILDSLKEGLSFGTRICGTTKGSKIDEYTVSKVDQKGGSSSMRPGDNLTVSMEIVYTGSKEKVEVSKASDSDTCNSLFADSTTVSSTELNAGIAYGRHLQNLNTVGETDFSTIKATQIDDIYLEMTWKSVYGSDITFAPINNSKVESYNGQKHIISGIAIGSATSPISGDAGLFSQFFGTKLTDIYVVGAKIYGTGNVGGIVGSIKSSSPVTMNGCRVYLDYACYNRIYAKDVQYLVGENVGGLIGSTEARVNILNSLAASVLKATTNAGGLIGQTSGSVNVIINTSYAACYMFGDVVGGIGGSINTDSTISDCYIAGFQLGISSKVAGITAGDMGSINNVYSVFCFEQEYKLPAGNSYYLCKAISHPDSSKNNYYIAMSSSLPVLPEDALVRTTNTTIHKPVATLVEADDIAEFKCNFGSGSELHYTTSKEQAGSSTPYNMKAGLGLTTYPYPFLVVDGSPMPMYGDWASDTVNSGSIVYFEQYSDQTYGFYGSGLDLLQDKPVVYDGYALAYNMSEDNYAVLLDSSETATVVEVTLKNLSDLENDNIVEISFDTEEQIIVDDTENNVSYRLCTLDKKFATDIDPQTFSDGFYTQVAVSMTSASANVDSRVTFYVNPHFAKTIVTLKPTEDEKIINNALSIRSARQLYEFAHYSDVYCDLTEGVNISQDMDIHYEGYNWKLLGYDTVTKQQAIGNIAHPFKANYHGNYFKITGLSLTTNVDCAGFIGCLHDGCVLDNLVLGGEVDDGLIVDGLFGANEDSSYLGTMVGWNRGTITNCATAGYTATVYATKNASIGGFVGSSSNKGDISNCTASVTEMNIDTANNSRLYVGGFIGWNQCRISNCYAFNYIETKDIDNIKDSIFGGFVGQNLSNIDISYCYCATSYSLVEGITPINFGRGCNNTNQYVAGSTYFYAGDLHTYKTYVLKESVPEEFVDHAVCVKMSEVFKDHIPSGYSEKAEESYYCEKIRTHKEDENLNYSYPSTVVKNASGIPVHYGEWIEEASLNEVGFFYWEHETGGSNEGYHYYLIPGGTNADDNDKGIEISTKIENMLCKAHDDGGVIDSDKGFGFGYYILNDVEKNVKISWEGIANVDNTVGSTKSLNAEAKKNMDENFIGYSFYPYYTQDAYASSNTDGLSLSGSKANGAFYIGNKSDDKGTCYAYKYTFSPFFAGGIQFGYIQGNNVQNNLVNNEYKSLTSKDENKQSLLRTMNSEPGTDDNQYQIRSIDQLQFINWNSNRKNAISGANNNLDINISWTNISIDKIYTEYTYLQHGQVGLADQFKGDTQSRAAAESYVPHRYWLQSHDLGSEDVVNFTSIASASDSFFSLSEILSDITGVQNRYLWAWFGNSYDGGSYKIKNLSINTSSYSAGLFGATAGAQIENVIMYANNDQAKIAKTGSIENPAYSLGGLIGIAYEYSNESDGYIRNCAIAGYTIEDSTVSSSGADCNIGGLVGSTSVDMENCSAVVTIKMNQNISEKGTRGNYFRVGGLVGSVSASNSTSSEASGQIRKIINCYTGGKIEFTSIGRNLLNQSTSGHHVGTSLTDWSEIDTVVTDSNNIYIGGLGGGAYTCNFRNFSDDNNWYINGLVRSGSPYYENCYTYMELPQYTLENTIRAVSVIGSLGEQYGNIATLTIENCYYLDTVEANITKDVDLTKNKNLTFGYSLWKILGDLRYGYKTSGSAPKLSDAETYMLNGKSVKDTNYRWVILGNYSFLSKRIPNSDNIASTYNINGLYAVNFDQLSGEQDIYTMSGTERMCDALNKGNSDSNKFNFVTVFAEDGVTRIDGKYSFPGLDAELQGENYPFPAIIKQGDSIWVHYGTWLKNTGMYSDTQSIYLDLMRYTDDGTGNTAYANSEEVRLAFYKDYVDKTADITAGKTVEQLQSLIQIYFGDINDKRTESDYQNVVIQRVENTDGKARIVAKVIAKKINPNEQITTERVNFVYSDIDNQYSTKITTNITADLVISVFEDGEPKQSEEEPQEGEEGEESGERVASNTYTFYVRKDYEGDEQYIDEYSQTFYLKALTNGMAIMNADELHWENKTETDPKNYYTIESSSDCVTIKMLPYNKFTVIGERQGTAQVKIVLHEVQTTAELGGFLSAGETSRVDSNNTLTITFKVMGEGHVVLANLVYDADFPQPRAAMYDKVYNQAYDGERYLKEFIGDKDIEEAIRPLDLNENPKYDSGLYILTQNITLTTWEVYDYRVLSEDKLTEYYAEDRPITIDTASALRGAALSNGGYSWMKMAVGVNGAQPGEIYYVKIKLRDYNTEEAPNDGKQHEIELGQYYMVPYDYMTVTLNANGGTWPDGNEVVQFTRILPNSCERLYGDNSAPTNDPKGITGWYTLSEGGTQVLDRYGKPILNVEGYTNALGWEDRNDVTLYAHWGNKYTLTLNDTATETTHDYLMVEGATVEGLIYYDGETAVDYDTMMAELNNKTEHTNERLAAWCDGDSEEIDRYGNFITENLVKDGRWIRKESVELTAKWTNSLTLKLHYGLNNTETASFEIPFNSSISVKGDVNYKPWLYDMKTNNQVLKGWTTKDGLTTILTRNGAHVNGVAVAGIVKTDGIVDTYDTIDLYANYTQAKYTLHLSSSETEWSKDVEITAYDKAIVNTTATFQFPTRKYYNLAGWQNAAKDKVLTQKDTATSSSYAIAESEVEGVTVTENEQIVWEAGDKSLSAIWERIKFTLSLILRQKGSSSNDDAAYSVNIDVEAGTEVTASSEFDEATVLEKYGEGFAKEHVEIVSWNDEPDGGVAILNADGTPADTAPDTIIEDGCWVQDNALTLYAQLQSTAFKVVLKGGAYNNNSTSAAIEQFRKEAVTVADSDTFKNFTVVDEYTPVGTDDIYEFIGWGTAPTNLVLDGDGNPAENVAEENIKEGKWNLSSSKPATLELTAQYSIVPRFTLKLVNASQSVFEQKYRYDDAAVTNQKLDNDEMRDFIGWGYYDNDNKRVLVLGADGNFMDGVDVPGYVKDRKWDVPSTTTEITLTSMWDGTAFELILDSGDGKWSDESKQKSAGVVKYNSLVSTINVGTLPTNQLYLEVKKNVAEDNGTYKIEKYKPDAVLTGWFTSDGKQVLNADGTVYSGLTEIEGLVKKNSSNQLVWCDNLDSATLYAHWDKPYFTLVLDDNDMNGKTYTFQEQFYTKATLQDNKNPSYTKPTMTGYTLDGWYTTKECSPGKKILTADGDKSQGWFSGVFGQINGEGTSYWVKYNTTYTIYPKWVPNNHQVKLVDGSVSNEYYFTFAEEASINNLKKKIEEKDKADRYEVTTVYSPTLTLDSRKAFIGWFTEADNGNNTNSENGVMVLDSTGVPLKNVTGGTTKYTDANGNWIYDGDLTLYAHYEREETDKYSSLTLDKNTNGDKTDVYTIFRTEDGGAANLKGEKDINGQIYSAPVNSGKALMGWYSKRKDGNGKGNKGVKVLNADGTYAASDGSVVKNGNWVATQDRYLYARWTDAYVVELSAPDAENEEGKLNEIFAAKTTPAEFSASGYDVAPERSGYTLVGFNTAANGGGVEVIHVNNDGSLSLNKNIRAGSTTYSNNDGKWMINKNITLYANWKGNTYTVTLNDSDGTKLTEITETYGENVVFNYTPSKPGYSFAGWYVGDKVALSSGGTWSTTYVQNGKWIYKDNVTFTAKWNGQSYDLTFNAMNGTENQTISVTNGTDTVTGYTAPGKTGHTLAGWYSLDPANSGAQLVMKTDKSLVASVNGYTDKNAKWGLTVAKTVYAKWTANKYDLVLMEEGVTTALTTISQTYGENVVLNYNTSRSGYVFNGWYIDDELIVNASGEWQSTAYVQGGKWMYDSGLTLTGKWTANNATLKLMPNGGSVSPDELSVTSGNTTAPTGYNAATRTGYTLNGWFTQATGGTKILDNAGVPVKAATTYTTADGKWIVPTNNSTVTLYAQWTGNPYTLTIVDDITGGKTEISETYGSTMTFGSFTTTKPGFVFDGIYNGETKVYDGTNWIGTGTSIVNAEGKWAHAGNLTLIAKWNPNSGHLSLNGNNGTPASQTLDIVAGQSSAPNYKAATRTGYTLDGWYTKTIGGTKIVEADGTPVVTENGTDYTTKDGKWIIANDGDTIALHAHWTGIEYTLTVVDEITTAQTKITETFGSAATTGSFEFTKTGYTFDGFYDGNTLIYSTGTGWVNSTYVNASNWNYANDATLTAKWKLKDIKLTLNDGSSTKDYTIHYGETASVNSLTNYVGPAPDRKIFTGWYTAASGGTKVLNPNGDVITSVSSYVANGKWILDGNTTLYAQYDESNTKKIELYVNGKLHQAFMITPDYSVQATLKGVLATSGLPYTVPSIEGKRVTGWYTQESGGSKVLNIDGTGVSNMVTGYISAGMLNYSWSKLLGDTTKLYAHTSDANYTVRLIDDTDEENTWTAELFVNNSEGADTLVASGYTVPTKEGYHVESWNTARKGSGSVVIKTNNGSNGTSGTPTLQPSVSGYTEGSSKWALNATVKELYVKWAPNNYTVTLVCNGSSENRTVTYDTDVNLGTKTVTGYAFKGWMVNGKLVTDETGKWLDNSYVVNGQWKYADNITFEAKLAGYAANVILNPDNGNAAPDPVSVTAGTTNLSTYSAPKKEYYTLSGWYTGKNGAGSKVLEANGNTVASSTYTDANKKWIVTENGMNIQLYAYWTGNTGKVKLSANSASSNKGVTYDIATGGYGISNIASVTKNGGWAIEGWYDGNSSSAKKVLNANGTPVGNSSWIASDGKWQVKTVGETLTLYAKWTRTIYKFTQQSSLPSSGNFVILNKTLDSNSAGATAGAQVMRKEDNSIGKLSLYYLNKDYSAGYSWNSSGFGYTTTKLPDNYLWTMKNGQIANVSNTNSCVSISRTKRTVVLVTWYEYSLGISTNVNATWSYSADSHKLKYKKDGWEAYLVPAYKASDSGEAVYIYKYEEVGETSYD